MTKSNGSPITTNSLPLTVEKLNQPSTELPAPSDELLTIAEVAVYLKLSRRTAWRWCKAGQLPAVKLGHQWRVARSDLEKFVRRRGKLL